MPLVFFIERDVDKNETQVLPWVLQMIFFQNTQK